MLIFPCLRRFATAAASHKFEKDGARILRVVEKRVQERTRLRSELSESMSSPEDVKRLRQLKESEPLQDAWDDFTSSRQVLQETKSLLDDPDPSMRSMALDEYTEVQNKISTILESTFPSLLLPTSTTRHLSAMLELKSGVGGTESSLFLASLLRMYTRYATERRWKHSVVAQNDNEGGGVKDVVMEIKGEGAYEALRWESGIHRVQRVPATESQGRVHTSTVAAIVLPLAEENNTQDEPLFSMDDVKVEVMRARGAGGQHVNKTESAVRLTHIPSGITVSMQDERSQHTNRRRAFQVLNARLLDRKITRDIAERRATRNNLVKSADRSEKIRTYNYAQERVTDHRIGLSIMNLSSVLEGDGLHDFIEALKKDYEEGIMEDMLREESDETGL